jgi:hypothetical protein
VISIGFLTWGEYGADNFFTILAYGVIFQLFSMLLLCISAGVLPFRRPELWRSATTARSIWGIPIITITAALALVGIGVVYFLYLNYSELGIAQPWHAIRTWAIVVGISLIVFIGLRWVRTRQGVDVAGAYAEIPPE